MGADHTDSGDNPSPPDPAIPGSEWLVGDVTYRRVCALSICESHGSHISRFDTMSLVNTLVSGFCRRGIA